MLAHLFVLAATAASALGGFDVAADGPRLHRLEASTGPMVALYYERSDDGGAKWGAPVRVDGGRPAYRFGPGDARVAGEGDLVFALWSRPGKGPYGSGPLAAARSRDGGRTWEPAASPAGDGDSGRRFPALAVSGGTIHAVWLDRSSNSKVLASRSTDAGKTWSKPALLDADACECCWNSLLAGGGTVRALWRGKGPRDMDAAASSDGGKTWSKPARVAGFDWAFDGCPHVGGALVPSGALIWTGKPGSEGLYFFRAAGGSARLGGPDAKHADAASSGKRVAAVWDEGGAIWSSSGDGAAWSSPVKLAAEGNHPRVAPSGAGFRAFWLSKTGALESASF